MEALTRRWGPICLMWNAWGQRTKGFARFLAVLWVDDTGDPQGLTGCHEGGADWETSSRWKQSNFRYESNTGSKYSFSPFTYNARIYKKFRIQMSSSLTLGLNSESAYYTASCVTLGHLLPLSKSQPLQPAPTQEKLYHSPGRGAGRQSLVLSSTWLSMYTEYLCSSPFLGLETGWLRNISATWVPSIILCTRLHIYRTVFEDGSRIQRNPLQTMEGQLFISKEGWEDAGTEENSGCVSDKSLIRKYCQILGQISFECLRYHTSNFFLEWKSGKVQKDEKKNVPIIIMPRAKGFRWGASKDGWSHCTPAMHLKWQEHLTFLSSLHPSIIQLPPWIRKLQTLPGIKLSPWEQPSVFTSHLHNEILHYCYWKATRSSHTSSLWKRFVNPQAPHSDYRIRIDSWSSQWWCHHREGRGSTQW